MAVFLLFIFAFLSTIVHCLGQQNYGILFANGGQSSQDFCVMFNPQWGNPWPQDLEKAPKHSVAWADPPLLCDTVAKNQFKDKAVVATRGNCSFYEKGMIAQQGAGKSAIIINTENHLIMPGGNESAGEYLDLKIPVVILAKDDGQKLKDLGKKVVVQMYQPEDQPIDGNIFILWILAVGTVVIGAYWTGITNKNIVSRHILQQQSAQEEGSNEEDDAASVVVTPLMVVIFVVLICGLLLLLFFFYNYLVYVVIVLFVLASCNGLFECLTPVVLWLPLGSCKVPPNRLPVFKNEPQIRIILLALFCVAIAVWWGVERNASYAWVLQDFLGIAFCISLLKNIRLPNLKVCIILLVLLLIYDIFFVFITPLFSANGKSVMVEVATGGGHKEQLPMVLKLPKLSKSWLSVCSRPYSLLGFGDILVPGLFIGFCHSFDILQNTPKKIYFVATSIAYGVGLIITFVALFLMRKGQPALLYLVPCVLTTGIVIALVRKEFSKLWTGKMVNRLPNNTSLPVQSESEDEILDRTYKDIETIESPSDEKQKLLRTK